LWDGRRAGGATVAGMTTCGSYHLPSHHRRSHATQLPSLIITAIDGSVGSLDTSIDGLALDTSLCWTFATAHPIDRGPH
jgi:hypothetical protein